MTNGWLWVLFVGFISWLGYRPVELHSHESFSYDHFIILLAIAVAAKYVRNSVIVEMRKVQKEIEVPE